MNKQNYIGKIVISSKTKKRYVLTKIHAAYISVGSEELNQYGTRSSYMFKTDNGDPFTSGSLCFEDSMLSEAFKREYADYCRSEDGRAEAWIYWMQTCD